MEFLTEEVIREVSIFRTHSQSISHALSLQKRENETGNIGKGRVCMLQRNIDRVLSDRTDTLRVSLAFFYLFSPPLSIFVYPTVFSPGVLSTCFALFIRVVSTTLCITLGRINRPYNRSLPRCARDFHKESYLLMRHNYPVHNGSRQHATTKSVGDAKHKRWARVEFPKTLNCLSAKKTWGFHDVISFNNFE